MKISVLIEGTIAELDTMWPWSILSRILNVDYYRKHLIDPNQVHSITAADLQRVGELRTPPPSVTIEGS